MKNKGKSNRAEGYSLDPLCPPINQTDLVEFAGADDGLGSRAAYRGEPEKRKTAGKVFVV